MDSKHKALLMHHKPFLAKNIVWSPQLSTALKNQGLLTEFMIQDIEACQNREDKVKLLVDVLPLKGNSSFNKFLDILQTAGHVFIADFLREDEEHQKIFDVKDMYRQLPFVKRAFNETEKKLIESYFAERIEAQLLKMMWKRDNREKDKALEARQQQIEQAYEYEDKLENQFKEKASVILRLEKDINASLEDKQELKAKLAALSAAHREMEEKHKESLDVQMRYNEANDNAVQRANERLATQENVLRSIKSKLDECVKLDSKKNQDKVTFEDEGDDEDKTEMKKAQNEYMHLLEDVDLFLRKFNKLVEVRRQYEKLLEERDYILIHFGFKKDINNKKSGGTNNQDEEEPSLVTAYKSFTLRNEENIMQMKKELEKYDGLLEENKAKLEDLSKAKDDKQKKFALGASTWQSAIMNVMRKQLQDVKTDLRKKESLIQWQEEEMNKLKKRIAELESQLQSRESDINNSSNPRDLVDGNISAVSTDTVELINSETPKPYKTRNLPPLKSSTYPHKSATSPRHSSLVKPKNPPAVVAQTRAFAPDPNHHIVNFPMGPITTQMKPEIRNGKPAQMGSVLGDLKAMNKHHTRGLLFDDSRSALRRSTTNLYK